MGRTARSQTTVHTTARTGTRTSSRMSVLLRKQGRLSMVSASVARVVGLSTAHVLFAVSLLTILLRHILDLPGIFRAVPGSSHRMHQSLIVSSITLGRSCDSRRHFLRTLNSYMLRSQALDCPQEYSSTFTNELLSHACVAMLLPDRDCTELWGQPQIHIFLQQF